jgi:hypothetical protein
MRQALDITKPGPDNCGYVFDDPINFVWKSTIPAVASVDPNGLVHALTVGSTPVSANGTASPYRSAHPATLDIVVKEP